MAVKLTPKYKKVRDEMNKSLRDWGKKPETLELFKNNAITPTNNNGLYELIKEHMNSNISELMQNIRSRVGSIGSKYNIVLNAKFLEDMGFDLKGPAQKNAIKAQFASVKKRRLVILERIKDWFNDEKNIQDINSILKDENDKELYTINSIQTIKNIYLIIDSKDDELISNLNKFFNDNIEMSVEQFKKLDLYKKYEFNSIIEKNLEDVNEINSFSKEELIKELTKSKAPIETENKIELFFSKVLGMELTDIKGWLIAAVKSDFKDINNIIKENKDDTKAMKLSIFKFINTRAITVDQNKISEPFSFNEDGSVNFQINKSSLPDILYFPKNKNSKPITAMNITSDPNTETSILIHSMKAAIIGNKIIEKSKNNNLENILLDYKNNGIQDDKYLNSLFKYKRKIDFIKILLKNIDNLDIDKIFQNLDFSVILNRPSISIYNKDKLSIDQKKIINESFLNEIEEYNVLLYSFFQSSLEIKKIQQLNITLEEQKIMKDFTNKVISNIEIGILSNYGDLTTIEKNNMNGYSKKLVELFTNQKTFNNFIDANSLISSGMLSDEFSSSITTTFYHLISDKNSRDKLIQNIANGKNIDLDGFIRKDFVDNFSTLTEAMSNVINKNKFNESNEVKLKIKNLENFIKYVDDFKSAYQEIDNDEILML